MNIDQQVKRFKPEKPKVNVKGDVENINDAIWKLSESNPDGGI